MLLAAPECSTAFGLEMLRKGIERMLLPLVLPGFWLEKSPVQAEGWLVGT